MIRLTLATLRRWRRDETGSVAIETLLMVPLLAWAFLATLVYFDAYRSEAIAEKANLTIADMMSRETAYITPDYLNGAQELLKFLTLHDDSPTLRITVFFFDSSDPGNPTAPGVYRAIWSEVQGTGKMPLRAAQLARMTDKLPIMSHEERAILVETWTDYDPPYETMWASALSSFEMDTHVVISPRFARSLCWNDDPGQDPAEELC